jgi:curved DNA-binding protein CbpA
MTFFKKENNKLPFEYPDPDEEDDLDPYLILGVTNNDSMAEITSEYKRLLRILHPDKHLTQEARKLGWSVEDKNIAFQKVQKAYKKITLERKYIENTHDYPDVYHGYDINSDYTINNDTLLDPNNFNQASFNKFFDEKRKKAEIDGLKDPFSIGYNSFGRNQDEYQSIKNGQGRPDISVEKTPKLSVPEMHNGRLVCRDPYKCAEEIVAVGKTIGGALSGYELGVSNISDFSTTCKARSGKDSLICADLMSVYGNNNEYWADSVARDKELFNKFNDDTRVEKKMNSYLGQRDTFDPKSIDENTQYQLFKEQEKMKQEERMRAAYLSRTDKYYTNNSRIKFD